MSVLPTQTVEERALFLRKRNKKYKNRENIEKKTHI